MIDHPEPRSAHPGVEEVHAHLSLMTLVKAETLTGASERFPDFSEFQGAVDWDALAAAFAAGQLDAVAMRAGFGTVRADAQFARNQREARVRGIPIIYYWFCYPAYNTPKAEAGMFNQTVGPLLSGEAMCGDFEDDPSARPFPRGAVGLQWCRDFLSALAAPPAASWWYTYPFLLSSVGLQPLIGAWPLWEADYSATPDSAFAQAIARQHTDCGATPGVLGCCDQSRVLRAPLEQWLTPGASASARTSGGPCMGTIVDIYDASGTRHSFRISSASSVADVPGPAGDLLWGRTTGGEGGALHAGYWRLGGSGPAGGIVDFCVSENPADGLWDITALFGPPNGGAEGGLELQTSLDPNAATKPVLTWNQPDNAGPWRAPVRRGEVLPAAMVPPGAAGLSEADVRAMAADEIEKRLANG